MLTALATAAAVVLVACPSHAGALVSPRGTRPRSVVETALITWDPTTMVQHLLVSARFEGADGPFLWWLPLPGPVEVIPVDADLRSAFPSLIGQYQRRTPDWDLPQDPTGAQRSWLSFGGLGKLDTEVLELPVSGEEVTWLRGRGLDGDLALRDWLERYAGTGHRVGSIHVVPKGPIVTTPYVHFSFRVDRPWYPYREPARQPDSQQSPRPRLLRTIVIAPECVAWHLGASLPTMAYAWLSFEPTSGELVSALGDAMFGQLGLRRGQRYWLTSFEDYHDVRPGNDDVSFSLLRAMPAEGDPGTVADKSGAGLQLIPVAPPGQHAGPSEVDAPGANRTSGDRRAAGARKRAWWSTRRARTGVVFGAMISLALLVAGSLAARGTRDRHR